MSDFKVWKALETGLISGRETPVVVAHRHFMARGLPVADVVFSRLFVEKELPPNIIALVLNHYIRA